MKTNGSVELLNSGINNAIGEIIFGITAQIDPFPDLSSFTIFTALLHMLSAVLDQESKNQ